MKLSEFDFNLPESLIAQVPSATRGDDRLMFLDRATGVTADYKMCDLPNLIERDTLMVFNNSKVRRARVFAKKLSSNSEKDTEFIFLHPAIVPPQNITSLSDSTLLKRDAQQLISDPTIIKSTARSAPDCNTSIKKPSQTPPLNDKSVTGSTLSPLPHSSYSAWVVMVKNARHCKAGNEYKFSDGTIARVISDKNNTDGALRTLVFQNEISEDWFNKVGHVPLPPYIRRADNSEDGDRYQTVYAKELGSVACPTAGLHFTKDMLDSLKSCGIEIAFITLHVGLGTFLPVREDNIEDHKMHTEVYTIDDATCRTINRAKAAGRPIMAVGTTAMRTLEAACRADGTIHSGTFSTDIFIYPPYNFKMVDCLFTNFHTPQSTLLMLVSAFAGRDKILNAYKSAIEKHYRFFSYGDAMLISNKK